MKKSTNRKDSKGRKLYVGESQRKDGRYMYRYIDKRTQKRCTVYADDLPELREKEKKIERDEQDGILTDVQTKNMTVNQLFERYLTTRRLKEYTRNDYVSMWNHHVAGEIGNAKVIELRSSDIKKLYNKLSELGLAYETIKYIHNMLAPTMELAVEDDIIRKNPAKNTLSKKYGKTPKPKKPLTKEQQEKLLEFVKDSKVYSVHYNMLVLFLECMNRRGEIAGLNESEIDFKNRVINVDHQLIYRKIEGHYQLRAVPPKTESGVRVLPMTQKVYDAIKDQMRLNKEYGKKSKREIDGYKDFLFLTKHGNPMMPSAINDVLYNVVEAYNRKETWVAENEKREPEYIPKFSSHILRHTACTNNCNAGMNVKVLQYLMGHKNIETTLGVYTHVDEIDASEEVRRLEDNTAK